MKGTHIVLTLALCALVAGCAQAPKQDIDAAQRSLEDARTAKAADYAPDAWNAAQDAEAKLQAELDAQQKKWAPTRSYAEAKQLAQTARAQADRASQEAVAGKEKAKNDATTLMGEARNQYKLANDAVAGAPRGKSTEADLASMKSDSTAIEQTLDEMQKAFDAGDYNAAKTKALSAIDAAKQIQSEIDQARTRRRAA